MGHQVVRMWQRNKQTKKAHDVPEPCAFRFNNSCQKRFLWAHKKVDLAPHPVVGRVPEIGDAEIFLQALGLERLDPFSQSQQAGSMSHCHRGGWW